MISNFRSFIFLLLAGAAILRGQSTTPEEFIEFRATTWNRDIPGVFYELKGKEQPFPLRRGVISQPQRYAGEPTLVFYTVELVDGERRKVPLIHVTLHRPPRKNLVVVWVDDGGAYRAMVLADDPRTPAPGEVRFVNVTGRTIALNSGDQTTICPVGGEHTVAARQGGVGIKVAVEIQSNGKWQLALMNGLRIRADERVTAFIADPSRLALAPEEEDKILRRKPLSLFVIRDTVPEVSNVTPKNGL